METDVISMGRFQIRSIFGIILAVILTTYSSAVAQPNGQASDMMSASAVYTRMVMAMRNQPSAGAISYNIKFVPHGLRAAVTVIGKQNPEPHLIFGPTESPENLDVKQSADGTIDALDTNTGLRYHGKRAFWAVTLNSVRSLATRPTDDVAPAPVVTSSPDQSSPSGGFSSVNAVAVIGDVATVSDRYYTTVLSPDSDDIAYHLQLKARNESSIHPLTDIYVDRKTFLPRTVVASFGNEAYVSGYGAEMRLTFGAIAGHWVVTSGTVSGHGHFLLKRLAGDVDFTINDLLFQQQ
jgi:hypothetical protein